MTHTVNPRRRLSQTTGQDAYTFQVLQIALVLIMMMCQFFVDGGKDQFKRFLIENFLPAKNPTIEEHLKRKISYLIMDQTYASNTLVSIFIVIAVLAWHVVLPQEIYLRNLDVEDGSLTTAYPLLMPMCSEYTGPSDYALEWCAWFVSMESVFKTTVLSMVVVGCAGWKFGSWSFSAVVLPSLVLTFLQPTTVVYVNMMLLIWGHEVLYKIIDRKSVYARALRHPVLYYTCHGVMYFTCGLSYVAPRLILRHVAISHLLFGIEWRAFAWIVFSLVMFGGCICTLQLFFTERASHIERRVNDPTKPPASRLYRILAYFSIELRILVAILVSTWACARGAALANDFAEMLQSTSIEAGISWQNLLTIELTFWLTMSILFWILLSLFLSICNVAYNKSYILNVEPKTRDMKLETRELRHPIREPVERALKKLQGAHSLYEKAKDQFDEKFALIGFVVLVMWDMRKSMASVLKRLRACAEQVEDPWRWDFQVQLDVENSSEKDVVWELTTVEIFCDRSRRRRPRRRGLRGDGWLSKLGLTTSLGRRRRRQRRDDKMSSDGSDLMAKLSFQNGLRQSKGILRLKHGVHRYTVAVSIEVPGEAKKKWQRIFRDITSSSSTSESTFDGDSSNARSKPTFTDRIADALLRTANITSVLKDNVKYFRDELSRALERYSAMRPKWDVRVVLQTEDLDVPSCLSFVRAPKICLPVVERNEFIFGTGNQDVKEEKTLSKSREHVLSPSLATASSVSSEEEDGEENTQDSKSDDSFSLHARMLRESGMDRFNKELRRHKDSAQEAHELRDAFMKAFLEDDEGSLVEVIVRLMKLYQSHVDDPESSVTYACEIVEYFLWATLIDIVQDAFGIRAFREAMRIEGREHVSSARDAFEWRSLSREERLEYFQRSRFKYLFRFIESGLVHFRDSHSYETLRNSFMEKVKKGVDRIRFPTVKEWLKTNSLLFVYCDGNDGDDRKRVQSGLIKLDLHDALVKHFGVRNQYLGDLAEIDSAHLKQLGVRDIYVKKFVRRLKEQSMPRKKTPRKNVTTSTEKLLKYLQMDHLIRSLRFYDLERLSELSEHALIQKGARVVEARVIRKTLRSMDIGLDLAEIGARCRSVPELLSSLNMSQYIEAFRAKTRDIALIELSTLDQDDLIEIGVTDAKTRDLFIRTATKLHRRLTLETSRTIGDVCTVLGLTTTQPNRPIEDLMACDAVTDLLENFTEVTFDGQEQTFVNLASALRDHQAGLDDDDDDDASTKVP